MVRTKEEHEFVENLKKEGKNVLNNFNINSRTTLTTISQYTLKTIGDGHHKSPVDKLKWYASQPIYARMDITKDMIAFVSDVELLLNHHQTLMSQYEIVLDEFCKLLKIEKPKG